MNYQFLSNCMSRRRNPSQRRLWAKKSSELNIIPSITLVIWDNFKIGRFPFYADIRFFGNVDKQYNSVFQMTRQGWRKGTKYNIDNEGK